MSEQPALAVENLHVSFGPRHTPVEVLRGVTFSVQPGECVALVGESGAGKSVLARTLIGLAGEGGSSARIRADRLEIAGTDARTFSQRQWRRLRGSQVGLVLQDALGSLDPLRRIGAEVGETLLVQRPRPARAERRARILGALRQAGLPDAEIRAAQRSGELSGGMRQRALIASAIVGEPALLLLDEPTTALDAAVAAEVLDLLARLRDAGTAMLLVTHDLGAVARIADRVVVLREGAIVEQGHTAQVLTAPTHPYTASLLAAVPRGPKRARPIEAGAAIDVQEPATPALEAVHLTRNYPLPGGGHLTAVTDLSLRVLPGRVLGVVGESGSGKSTLARLLLAAEQPDAGDVFLNGAPWSSASERERRVRRRQIRLIPQDPLASFDPRLTARAILRDAATLVGSATSPQELLAAVHLDPAVLDRRARTLSGGQRQRLAIARALAANPDVLVCDEPVSALDVTIAAEILDLLEELQASRALTIVFISHDLAVVRRVCDDVVVMSDGRIVESGPVEQVWSAPQHPVTRALLAAAPTLP